MIDDASARTGPGTGPARPPLTRAVLVVAAAAVALLVEVAPHYGPHRDELYFLAAGRRLAWGYPDQPPLTPAIARLVDEIAPGSLVALRVVSAVALAATVLLAALCARELGGGRTAQLLTALVTASSAVTLAVGHLLSTATFDALAWTAVSYLVLRTLLRGEPRLWLVVGLVAGVGLQNKTLLVALLVALAVGVLVTPPARRHLASPWLWAGVVLAMIIWLPNLLWQASQGWPQLELASDIQDEYGAVGERVAYVGLQLVHVSPLATPLWIFGIVRLLRDQRWRVARPVGLAYVVLFVLFLVVGGKAYYLAGLVPVLLAAGSVALVERWPERRVRRASVVLVAVAAVGWPVGLPVLPLQVWVETPYAAISDDQLNTIGWPAFVDQVQDVVVAQDAVLVLTRNYGEAGALEWYGSDVPVVSGHNGYGLWGPPPDDLVGPVVVVGYDDPDDLLDGCELVTRIDVGVDADVDEQDAPVMVCDGPAGSWSSVWPSVLRLSA